MASNGQKATTNEHQQLQGMGENPPALPLGKVTADDDSKGTRPFIKDDIWHDYLDYVCPAFLNTLSSEALTDRRVLLQKKISPPMLIGWQKLQERTA
jgi:hypothetical protein